MITPHNSEAEQALIGSAILSPEAYTTASEMGITPDSFHGAQHGAAWRAIGELVRDGLGVDPLTLLERMGKGYQDLGPSYWVELIQACPTSANADTYAAIVLKEQSRRRVVQIASNLVTGALNGVGPDKAATIAARELDRLAQSSSSARVDTAEDAANEFYETFEHWVKTRKMPGLPYRLGKLDYLTGGRRRKELMIIAARPGMGKSSFAGQLSYADARAGLRVSVCTLEMSKSAWIEQAILSDLTIKKTTAGEAELVRVRERAIEAQSLPMRFYERGYCTPEELELNIHLHARAMGGLDVVYVDHLGYIDHGSGRIGNTAYAIGVTTKRLARLAKELDCVVIALCQLNRSSEIGNREPALTDLRDSGEIEQDARLVMFLHRKEYKNFDKTADQSMQPEECKVIIAKNNSGQTSSTVLAFTRAYRRFSEYASNEGATGSAQTKPYQGGAGNGTARPGQVRSYPSD